MMRRLKTALLLATVSTVLLVTLALAFLGQDQNHDFHPIRVVDRFPPITQFPVVPVAHARDTLHPSELVIGVTIGNQSRAYPINMLTGPQREILNDVLGGEPIAATW